MHDPSDPPSPRWTSAIARLDAAGSIGLSRDAIDALGPRPSSLRWHRLAIVLPTRRAGRVRRLGRLLLAARSRRPSGTYLIDTERDAHVIVLVPTAVLAATWQELSPR